MRTKFGSVRVGLATSSRLLGGRGLLRCRYGWKQTGQNQKQDAQHGPALDGLPAQADLLPAKPMTNAAQSPTSRRKPAPNAAKRCITRLYVQ